MNLNESPRGNRIHIGLFGRTNSGKSSIMNALTGQKVALVSEYKGTTTDPVYKAIELHPIGPCVIIDTAGFDDESLLGAHRVEATKKVLDKTDIALVLLTNEDILQEKKWINLLQEKNIPIIPIINKVDVILDVDSLSTKIKKETSLNPIQVSAKEQINLDKIREAIGEIAGSFIEPSICAHLVKDGDVVLLVMPQDIQAPKGRLILPQVQTIRDLLDNKCIVLSVTADKVSTTLEKLKAPPQLIITDSQVFPEVYAIKPKESRLTSFSVLFSRYKGDIDAFTQGAYWLDSLKAGDKVLIAEACSHNPLDGDIGRVKLPAMIHKKIHPDITVEVVSGNDFPENLTPYTLIIHCGSCMFNRKHVLSRIEQAKAQHIPITNYGIAIAHMNGILDKIEK
ncbi:[FeFe] hydrogenase H-cluster maturation GTPase HydF [Anaerotignum sp. MB30-C6]|uniref:[FeFe] hydrogenase H-cluster maturation GTPase HydF n=1 Tax=Anaerotignum sp. MB30-C6 TaxID=3070814 RepID=UPI0027DD4936|nr:[FeFe] hydrogenase H-cluster maturation GTPase HydF [Anaerotignum sp. MB30-C6]WMI79998.1 [FeFe] hydrogenase H-cluster maturation GTPase HydF [Anaerotignum sp. MB30-C6]